MNKQAQCTLTCLTAAGGLGVASGSISVPFKVLWGERLVQKKRQEHISGGWVGVHSHSGQVVTAGPPLPCGDRDHS